MDPNKALLIMSLVLLGIIAIMFGATACIEFNRSPCVCEDTNDH